MQDGNDVWLIQNGISEPEWLHQFSSIFEYYFQRQITL